MLVLLVMTLVDWSGHLVTSVVPPLLLKKLNMVCDLWNGGGGLEHTTGTVQVRVQYLEGTKLKNPVLKILDRNCDLASLFSFEFDNFVRVPPAAVTLDFAVKPSAGIINSSLWVELYNLRGAVLATRSDWEPSE